MSSAETEHTSTQLIIYETLAFQDHPSQLNNNKPTSTVPQYHVQAKEAIETCKIYTSY